MTVLKYVVESKVATTAEILAYKREDPKGFDSFLLMAAEEMRNNNIPIDAPPQK